MAFFPFSKPPEMSLKFIRLFTEALKQKTGFSAIFVLLCRWEVRSINLSLIGLGVGGGTHSLFGI